jgi:rubrerythrin
MHRPKWNDNVTIVSDKAWHSRVQENGDWWTIEIPVGSTARGGIEGTVRFRARLGNAGIGAAELRRLQLTRRKDMTGWRYYVSVTIITQERKYPGTGVVGLDWGHREHGHALASAGIRAFTWWGDDGRCGEILIPREARECLDRCSTEQSRIDVAWDARKKTLELDGIRSRHGYRKRVMRNGVRSKDERLWLMWETRIERRRQAARKRAAALRREAYIAAVKELRQWYATFVIEDQPGKEARDLDTEEMTRHRKRQNRELVARYEFVSRCERSGAAVIRVSARNTTRECPTCGVLAEKTQDLLIACPGCGIVRDRDYGAAKVILRRGEQVLAVSSASAQDHSGAAQ